LRAATQPPRPLDSSTSIRKHWRRNPDDIESLTSNYTLNYESQPGLNHHSSDVNPHLDRTVMSLHIINISRCHEVLFSHISYLHRSFQAGAQNLTFLRLIQSRSPFLDQYCYLLSRVHMEGSSRWRRSFIDSSSKSTAV
jgi:hypothetical protein